MQRANCNAQRENRWYRTSLLFMTDGYSDGLFFLHSWAWTTLGQVIIVTNPVTDSRVSMIWLKVRAEQVAFFSFSVGNIGDLWYCFQLPQPCGIFHFWWWRARNLLRQYYRLHVDWSTALRLDSAIQSQSNTNVSSLTNIRHKCVAVSVTFLSDDDEFGQRICQGTHVEAKGVWSRWNPSRHHISIGPFFSRRQVETMFSIWTRWLWVGAIGQQNILGFHLRER